jgi:hypothetical protein
MLHASVKFLGLAAAMALSSCSFFAPDSESLGGLLLTTASGVVTTRDGETTTPAPETTAAQDALNRIATTGRAGLLVTTPRLGQTTVMIMEQQNGPYRTFRGGNNTSITLKSGIVTETRGMGVDLMAQAVAQPESGLFTTGSFPKEVARVQRHLDGENHLLSAEFLCVIERKGREDVTIMERKHATTLFEETCRNSNRAFLNRYWVGTGTGTVWQSQQSISSASGHVISQYIAGK